MAPAQSPPPHIVFLFADDFGWTDLSTGLPNGGNPSDYYRTPHMDRMASLGMSFTDFYTNGPNCAPTRAALMSGRWGEINGIYTVDSGNRGNAANRLLDAAPNNTTLPTSFVTLAETLRTAGYATGHFGKWHLGDDPTLGPTAQGFDRNVAGTGRGSVSGGSSGHFAQADGSFNLPNCPANGVANQFMADRLTDEAVAWMGQHLNQPFFCYLTHFSVHTPIQAPTADRNAFNGVPLGVRHRNQTYAGMLKNLDDGIGRVVAFLENTADPRRPGHMLIENTVVVFTSDNGGLGGYASAGVSGGQEITHQYPLRSGKGSLHEGGIRVPLMVRWDGVVTPGAVRDVPLQSFDLYPTLAAIAGASVPPSVTLDGEDFAPVLRGQSNGPNRSALFWHFPGYLQASTGQGTWRTTPVSVIRRGTWKLMFFYETRSWHLYDLASDIGENVDVATNQPGLVRSMGFELRNWLISTNARMPRDKATGQQVPLPDPPGGPRSDTVEWTRAMPQNEPVPLAGMQLVDVGSELVGFGGAPVGGVSGITWRYAHPDWIAIPLGNPPGRVGHAMAFDPQAGELVLFGGADQAGGLLGDTWTRASGAWSMRQPTSSPRSRRDHAMVLDADGDGALLFGGHDASGVLGETWEFRGGTWSQLAPTLAPAARSGHGMVRDPDSGTVWLFGGFDGAGAPFDDLWSWDGTSWLRTATATTPAARGFAAVSWDGLRDRLVVHGGVQSIGGLSRDDTWEFDGSDWRERTPSNTTGPRSRAAVAFDPGSRQTILFGGEAGTVFGETWLYGAVDPAGMDSYGAGCLGTGGTPSLSANPEPWLGESVELVLDGLPASLVNCYVALGTSDSMWSGGPLPFDLGPLGAPGCSLLAEPALVQALIGLFGQARTRVAIPSDPSLAGVLVHAQGLVYDPSANALDLTVSQGLELRLGVR